VKNSITTTGADLAQSLASAIDTGSIGDLRMRYHRCDLLLVDDLHFLASKPTAQQFLVVALDALIRRGSLVMVTLQSLAFGSSPLSGFLPALASRLAGGLVAPIAPPGAEARRTLVRQAARRARLSLSDEALDQLAQAKAGALDSLTTAPILRHAVLQLAAQSSSPGSVDPAIRGLQSKTCEVKEVARQVAIAVSKYFRLPASQLRGKSRRQTVAEARGLAMYVTRQATGASYAEIGRHFGGRDHTTVLHACRKFQRNIMRDETTRQLVIDLRGQVKVEVNG
jgi:chromosomal replication initiator protein